MPRIFFNYDTNCPHCEVYSHFSLSPDIKKMSNDLNRHISIFNLCEDIAAQFLSCDNCNKLIIGYFKNITDDTGDIHWSISFTYPIISEKKFPDGVPKNIWEDYIEGVKCISVDAPKGAVVLFRRALQSLVKSLGANKTKRLYEQIEELKNNGIITEDLYNLATEVRLWGNFGAHPDDDLLSEITVEEATEMRDIFDLLLNYTFIQKSKVDRIKAKRIAKKK